MRRVLGLGDLLLIAAASVGPAFSLATTFGPMVEAGGSATPLALCVVTLLMLCIAGGYRRLGIRYPNAGSSYTWVRVAFGPSAGAYAAWILIVANVFATVATALPAGAYTLALVPGAAVSPLADALIATAWVAASGLLVWTGLRPTSRVANVLVLLEFAVLGAAAAAAFFAPPVAAAAGTAPGPGLGGLTAAVVIGIWMIDGWEVSASTAEEASTGSAGPGAGGIGGLVLSGVILWLCMTAFLRIGTPAGFADHESDAMAYVAGALPGGAGWRTAVTATVLVSLAASLQATLVYLTRSFYAMGRDGVLPAGLGGLDRRGQPATAVVLLTVVGMAGTLASGLSPSVRAAFDFILSGTAVFLCVLFLLSALAAVRLFAGDRAALLDGALLPGAAAVALAALLGLSVVRADPATRLFLLGAAAAGLPLAAWRGRSSPPSV